MEDLTFFEDIYRLEPAGTADNPSKDTASDLFQTYSVQPVPPEQYPSLADVGDALALPFKVAAKAGSTVVDAGKSAVGAVTGTIKNTYLYLVGGIALVGIIAIVVLGAGTKFLGKVEG